MSTTAIKLGVIQLSIKTPTQPKPTPLTNWKDKSRTILSKQKLLVYIYARRLVKAAKKPGIGKKKAKNYSKRINIIQHKS